MPGLVFLSQPFSPTSLSDLPSGRVSEDPGPYRAEARFEAGATHVAMNPDGLPVGFRFRAGDDPDPSGFSRVDVITPRGVFEVSRERGLRLIDACDRINEAPLPVWSSST